MSQLALDLLQPLQPSLDNFVPGRNAEALAALRARAAGQGPQFIYLWGEPGCGRSHLLSALASLPSTVPSFSAERSLYVIDDAQQLNDAEQARLFALANEVRAHPQTGLVVAGNVAPALLPLREDVRTRLSWGLSYALYPLSDEEKAQALHAHAASRGLVLPTELVHWMLVHLPRDMRTLVAALNALDRYALAKRRALTLVLAREWITQAPPVGT